MIPGARELLTPSMAPCAVSPKMNRQALKRAKAL